MIQVIKWTYKSRGSLSRRSWYPCLTRRPEKDVTTTGVSTKEEDRGNIGVSDKLKLSKAVQEGGSDEFAFFSQTEMW